MRARTYRAYVPDVDAERLARIVEPHPITAIFGDCRTCEHTGAWMEVHSSDKEVFYRALHWLMTQLGVVNMLVTVNGGHPHVAHHREGGIALEDVE